jgi:signal transduction histidine kinase/CHASE1-domain containing sensor protein/CheY-like chemotaxis protein
MARLRDPRWQRIRQFFVLSHEWNVFIILLIILAISLASWWTVKVHLEKEWLARLEAESGKVISKIERDFHGYGQALSDNRAYFQISGIPTAKQYQRYIDTSELFRRFPGLSGIAFAEKLDPSQKDDLEKRKRAEGYPEFAYWPNGTRGLYTAITLIQPEDWRNKKALGFDMYSEPNRREAMDKAIKTNAPAITDPITLIQDTSEANQAGLLIYLPVFRTEKAEPDVTDLRAALLGFSYAVVNVNKFFNGALGTPQFYNEKVNYRIEAFDHRLGKSVPIYERFSGYGEDRASVDVAWEESIPVFDKTWSVRFEPLPHFFNWYERYIPILFAFVTLVMLSVIFLALWSTQQFLKFSERHKESLSLISKNKSDEIILIRRLNAVLADLTSAVDASSLYEKFTNHLREVFGIEDCVVYIREESGPFEKRFEEKTPIFPDTLDLPLEFDRFVAEKVFDTRGKFDGLPKLLSWFSPEVRRILEAAPYYITRSVLHESGKSTSILVLARGTQNLVPGTIAEYAFGSMISQFAMSYDKAILLRRAEDANVMKSSFLANMSHEIRTPLGVIVGYSEILAEENLEVQEKEQIVKSVKRNGKELARLIDDILDISKVEAGKLHFEMAQVNLENLMQEIKSIMEVRASDRKINFNIAKLSNVPQYVITDDIRLKQILINVVGNAIKFTETGGVKLLYKTVVDETGEDIIEFQIQDSGIGISERNRQNLFKPFSQGDVSTTRKYGGTGLGLALSKRLAELLGGDLYLLESSLGKGSTFCLRIPMKQASLVLPLPRQDVTAAKVAHSFEENQNRPIDWSRLDLQHLLKGVRILLVEDSEDNQEIFQHFLKSAGAEVKVAEDGEMGVAEAFAWNPDLVLMDIQIPKMDGKQATKTIRNRGFAKPVIALTAHALTEEIESCLEAGCNGQITKPVSGELLIQEVYFYLNHRG